LGNAAPRTEDSFGNVVSNHGDPIDGEPNASLANMRRCGFEQICSRLSYAAPAA